MLEDENKSTLNEDIDESSIPEGTETDETGDAAEGSEGKETTPETGGSISVARLKELAKEHGLDDEEFAKLDDADEVAKRAIQQMKGFRNLYRRMRDNYVGTHASGPPMPGAAPVSPADKDAVINELLDDPNAFFAKRFAAQQYQGALVNNQRQIAQWEMQQNPAELQQCIPYMRQDPVIAQKASMGQPVTLDDIKPAFENARERLRGDLAALRTQGYNEGLTAGRSKKSAVVEEGRKPSGKSEAITLEGARKKYGVGNIPEDIIEALLAAEQEE